MITIEPCCTQKNLLALRNTLGPDGTTFIHAYGDLSLTELLPAIINRYSEAEITIVAPALPDATVKVIKRVMNKKWSSADGKGKINAIGHMTIITNLSEAASPQAAAWLEDNPYGERLTLKNTQQNDTAVILPDIAIFGQVNLVYGGHFIAVATTRKRTIAMLKEVYESL